MGATHGEVGEGGWEVVERVGVGFIMECEVGE